jgi:hypothetical protein
MVSCVDFSLFLELSILICGKFQDYSGESTVNSKVKGARNEVHLAAWAQGADVTDGGYDALSIVDNAAGLFCRATELQVYQPPASSTFLSERTSHQQPAATSQQYSSLRTNQRQPSATSQPNRLYILCYDYICFSSMSYPLLFIPFQQPARRELPPRDAAPPRPPRTRRRITSKTLTSLIKELYIYKQ